MRINASWFGLHWPTEYKYVGASVCVHRQAPLGYGYQCFGPIAGVCLSAISLLNGLARSSKVDQDGLAARSNKRMGTEKVKKEEVVQRTQLDNKSPIQVHHDEGVANRIDPESCADAREGIGEALTGERTGQPLSRESTLILGADVVPLTEGNTDGRDIASVQTARRGRRHWHVRTLFAREPGDLMVGQRQHACCTGPCREGEEP